MKLYIIKQFIVGLKVNLYTCRNYLKPVINILKKNNYKSFNTDNNNNNNNNNIIIRRRVCRVKSLQGRGEHEPSVVEHKYHTAEDGWKHGFAGADGPDLEVQSVA